MPDSLATMLASINDGGANTAAEMRAVIEALYFRQAEIEATPSGDDIEWEGSDVASLTLVTVTGSQTLAEKGGRVGVEFVGLTDGDLNCLLAPVAVGIGNALAVSIRGLNISGAFTRGVVLTDGTTSGANAIFYGYDNFGGRRLLHREGTLTGMGTSDWQVTSTDSLVGDLHVMVEHEASNTFRGWFSPDGVIWTRLEQANASFTMTPTHAGIAWGTFGASATATPVGSFGPLRFVTV